MEPNQTVIGTVMPNAPNAVKAFTLWLTGVTLDAAAAVPITPQVWGIPVGHQRTGSVLTAFYQL